MASEWPFDTVACFVESTVCRMGGEDDLPPVCLPAKLVLRSTRVLIRLPKDAAMSNRVVVCTLGLSFAAVAAGAATASASSMAPSFCERAKCSLGPNTLSRPSQAQTATVATHPTAGNLAVEARAVGRIAAGSKRSRSLQRFLDRFGELRTVRQVGVEDGEENEVIGAIEAAAVDGRGRVLVLDRAFQNVRVFDGERGQVTVIGRRGSGPLDLRAAYSIWPVGRSGFAVADGVLGVKYILAPTRDSVRLQRTVPIRADITAGCGIGQTVAVYRTPSEDTPVVAILGESGSLLRAFGSPYKTDVPLVRSIMSEGVMGCSADGRIAYALNFLPFVHVYQANGMKLWSFRIGDFRQGFQDERQRSDGRRSIGLSDNTKDFSSIARITAAGDGLFLVQVAYHTVASRRLRNEFARLDTYIIDSSSGDAEFLTSKMPLVAQVSGSTIVTFSNDPFPRVTLMQIGS
jgi:hypothetical protein